MRRRLIGALRSPGLQLTAAAGFSGLATYVFLALVANGLGEVRYSEFSWFWSLTVIAGLGVYLPIEQETTRAIVTSRSSATTASGRSGMHRVGVVAVCTGIGVALLGTVVLLVAGQSLIGRTATGPLVAVALVVSWIAYSFQFPVRGALGGGRFLSRYALLLAVEAAARIALATVVALVASANVFVACLVVAFAAVASAGVAVIRFRDPNRQVLVHSATFTSGVARLVAGGIVVQVLLNLPPIIAVGAVAGSGPSSGKLLVALTLARIPVFIYQSLQTLVVPRLSAAWSEGRMGDFRRAFLAFVLLGAVVSGGWLVVITAAGPWLVDLIFGADFAMTSDEILPVAVGVSILTVAMLISDSLLSTGGHSQVLLIWAAALVAAVVAFALAGDLARSTSPVIAGASAAVIVGALLLVRRLGRANAVT